MKPLIDEVRRTCRTQRTDITFPVHPLVLYPAQYVCPDRQQKHTEERGCKIPQRLTIHGLARSLLVPFSMLSLGRLSGGAVVSRSIMVAGSTSRRGTCS